MVKSNKKILMPILAIVLCMIMVATCVFAAFAMDKTIINNPEATAPSLPPMSSTVGGLELPSDHDVRKVDAAAQLATGKVRKNYVNNALVEPIEIYNKYQLMAWLISANNADRDAKLMNNISFDWTVNRADVAISHGRLDADGALIPYAGAKLTINTGNGYFHSSQRSDVGGRWAKIYDGRVLDGYGYTITYDGSDNNQRDICAQVAFFAKDIAGKMQNVTFVVPNGKTFTITNNSNEVFSIGFLCVEMSATAVLDNVKVEFGGTFGKNTGEAASTYAGIIASRMAGTINNSEVSYLAGAKFKIGTNSVGALGAFAGQGFVGAQGAKVNNCVFNLNNNLNTIFTDFGGANGLYSTGIFADASNAKINNFIVKNADVNPDNAAIYGKNFKWSYFFALKNDSTVATNLYLLNNSTFKPTTETAVGFSRIDKQIGFDLEWDRSVQGRIVIRRNMVDTDSIFWDIQQDGGKSYNELYRYLITSDTLLSLPAYSPAPSAVGGTLFKLTMGDVGKLTSMKYDANVTTIDDPDLAGAKINNAIYTGREYSIKATFANMKGNVEWNDALCYSILYKDLLNKPVLPGTFTTKIQSTASDKVDKTLFAYLDAINHRLVLRDDNYTTSNFTLNISLGKTDIISKKVGIDEYVDGTWADKNISVKVNVKDVALADPSDTKPNKIRVTFATAEEQANAGDENIWIDTKAFSSSLFLYTLSISCSDKPVRFALFKDDLQLTTISDDSIFSKVDVAIPNFSLDAASHSGTDPVRNLNKWMDRYNADGNTDDNNEVAQIWIKTTAGASGINVSASGRKKNADGTYGEASPFGALLYQPLYNNSIIDPNIFAQRMYDKEKSRAENAADLNGEWEITFKAVNGAGKVAKVSGTNDTLIVVNVKVDYNDYYLDADTIDRVWNGSNSNEKPLVVLDNTVCDIKINYGERKYFFRNEAMKYDISVKEVDDNTGYIIATANGINVPSDKKLKYSASYSHDDSLPIGTQPDIAVGLKKHIKAELSAVADQEYGNLPPNIEGKVNLPAIKHDDITFIYKYTIIITDAKSMVVDLNNKKLPVGKYNISVKAAVNTGDTTFDNMCNAMYDLDIKGTTYNVTHKKITLTYNKSTRAFSLRNFDKFSVQVEAFDSQIVEGDKVTVTGIFPSVLPKEEDLKGNSVVVESFATLSNANYVVVNSCMITLAAFLTDANDPTIFLLESPSDILAIKNDLLGSKFKLNSDIDFESKAIYGIGDFRGTFDGNGYAIKNVKIISNNSILGGTMNVGLFASLSGKATVKNLTISNMIVDVKANNTTTLNVGGIAGVADDATVDNVSLQGTLYVMGKHKDTAAGVLFGRAKKANISNVMTVATVYFVEGITNNVKQNIIGGGIAGELTNSTLSKVSAINQGYINSSVVNGANYIAAVNVSNTISANVYFMKGSLLNGGEKLTGDANKEKSYAYFLADATKFGQSVQRGGASFSDIMTELIPSSMRVNGLKCLEVKNHRELVFMLNYNFADYKIMKDIYCFTGFNYVGNYKFAGKITNENGYKIYADNGVFDIGNL